MIHRLGRRGLAIVLAVVVLIFGGLAPLWAGGSGEVESDHDAHELEHEHMEGHHIEPIVPDEAVRLAVVATTSIVGDVVRQVVGDAADLTVLMDIGQNPHAWEPTPRAIGRIEEAHLLFMNGINLEEGLMEIIDSIDTGYVLSVSEGIEVLGGSGHHGEDAEEEHDDHHHDEDHDDGEDDHDEGDGHHHAAGDPHVWFDPNNVIVWVENIEHALSAADPGNAAEYEENAERYIAELQAIDREVRDAVAMIPPERRKLVIDHVALAYFADRYEFEVLGTVIPSVTDQAEPSASDLAALVETIESERIGAIFVGGTASRGLRRMTETVAEEVGRPIEVRELLTGSLTADGRGDTYLEFVRYNTRQIVEGLSN